MIYGRELPGYPYNLAAKMTRCLVAGRRLVFGKWLARVSSHAPLPVCARGQAANDLIRSLLEAPAPCLVARFGSGEMEATLRGLDVMSTRGGGFAAGFGVFSPARAVRSGGTTPSGPGCAGTRASSRRRTMR